MILDKWIVFVASFAGLLYLISMPGQLVVGLTSQGNLPQPPLWFELLYSVALLGFATVPVAIGFAVLRYRPYDIDVIPRISLTSLRSVPTSEG